MGNRPQFGRTFAVKSANGCWIPPPKDRSSKSRALASLEGSEWKRTKVGAMAKPRIQFLVFRDCPLAGAARGSLVTALAALGLRDFEEVDILDPATPDELRGWGSPTILVDGEDVTGNPKGEDVACRVYDTPDGVPAPETIAERIKGLIETKRVG